MIETLAREMAAGSWKAAGKAWTIDKTLASLFGSQALAYQHVAEHGLDNATLIELEKLQADINTRIKFREECN